MNLLFWKRKPPKIAVIRRDHTKLRLHEWRSQESLVSTAAKIWADSGFRLMMDVAQNEHPAFQVLPWDASPDARASQQARGEGYTIALANLEAMAQYKAMHEPVEAEFAPEEIEQ